MIKQELIDKTYIITFIFIKSCILIFYILKHQIFNEFIFQYNTM